MRYPGSRVLSLPLLPASWQGSAVWLFPRAATLSQQRTPRDSLVPAFLGLLVPVEEEHGTLLILGVLLTLRYLVPLLQQQVKDTSLKGSFGVTRKEMEVSPSTEQLVQVGAPQPTPVPVRRHPALRNAGHLKRSSRTKGEEHGLWSWTPGSDPWP